MINISIIIPTRNEERNVETLVKRIDAVLQRKNIQYEIIFVDDHSTDKTQEIIKILSNLYPIQLHSKKGKIGKAYSLLEGFTYTKYDLICIIDADLQYPPESIPKMISQMKVTDICVAQRNYLNKNLRQFLSKVQLIIFDKLIHGIDVDVQSGLKVFKKEIIERFSLKPTPWTFDLEFLVKAKNAGYRITSIPIDFFERQKGQSKVNILQASAEIAWSSLKLRYMLSTETIPFHPTMAFILGKGFHYKGHEFIHHSDLSIRENAFFRLTVKQQIWIISLSTIALIGLLLNWHMTVVVLLSILTVFYFMDLLFQLFLIIRNFQKSPEIDIPHQRLKAEKNWPLYTIFCPLYKESVVLPQFISAIQSLEYPKDRLQVMLLLEEDDKESIKTVHDSHLPFFFETVIVPQSLPKTKPKALNFGLSFATGEFVVVYDAEDIPDPLQLKKVVLAFQKADKRVACIQAKLNFYNPHQNILTRIFTAEYSLWFDLILTGLQSLESLIPLGGTSNHFRTKDLIELKGWDSFNVTEDCDLGIRLIKAGYQTAIVDSLTLEEANSNIVNWFHQRGRWIKGYIQSYFVHLRNPKEFINSAPLHQFFSFQFIVGGRMLSLFINPFFWAITIIYFVFRASVGNFIESFFPAPIFYIGIFSMLFGNFLYMYYYMIATVKRKDFGITKYAFLTPFYWLCMSFAAWIALYKMIVEPHYWAKTVHGLHLQKQDTTKSASSSSHDYNPISWQTYLNTTLYEKAD